METVDHGTLGRQIRAIHQRVREVAPGVQRIAMALYQPDDDLLTTFLNSTIDGLALEHYHYRLSDVYSLQQLAAERMPRLLTDLPAQLGTDTQHSRYLLSEGYLSSFTVPMLHHEELFGFIFFDSIHHDTFPSHVQRELMLHAGLLAMSVANELLAISSVTGAMQIARDFAAARDHETGAHMDRMARYSRIIARETADHFGLDDETVEHVFRYAPLHDIGKIGVPDHILFKRSPLDPDEWETMKAHTTRGAEMMRAIVRDLVHVEVPEPQLLLHIVELHHEKLDGSGYPRGLRGDEIPPEARIVAVADVFDALTTERSYKVPWSFDHGAAELRREVVKGLLDGMCVEALLGARD
ncbi:MAG: HD domain-containing phosphohydrolase, partial [Acidobacteriota bacterium]